MGTGQAGDAASWSQCLLRGWEAGWSPSMQEGGEPSAVKRHFTLERDVAAPEERRWPRNWKVDSGLKESPLGKKGNGVLRGGASE